MSSSKDWKAKIHKQHQEDSSRRGVFEDKSLSSVNETPRSEESQRYDNRDTEVKSKSFGTHKTKRTKY